MKGVMIAAPQSGSGKTVMTLALLRALKDAGVAVSPAKAGPDFIDPAFHTAAAGTTSINLDPWAMRGDLVSSLAAHAGAGGHMLVVEAMMGLFDGALDGTGSAADLARQLGLPVVLVIDAQKLGHSVAALVRGFRDHRRDIVIAGVILNRTGSDRHEALLRGALAPLNVDVLGAVRRSDALAIPERHLGLVQASENAELEDFIAKAAALVSKSVDLKALQKIGAQMLTRDIAGGVPRLKPLGQRMAVARDKAFAFSYPHLLEGWRRQGAELSFFSPLAGEVPLADADAVYLPGGYPELNAGTIAANEVFRSAMAEHAAKGTMIYGECGGYMVLGEGITDADGERHAMLGLLPVETSFQERKLHLGYRKLVPLTDAPFSMPLTAHEFHYATTVSEGEGERLFAIKDALDTDLGLTGLRRGSVCGSFMHIIDRTD